MSIESMQQQIDDLQSRIAYQEDLLQQLNDVIARQDKQIQNLEQSQQQQQEKLQDVAFQLESTGTEKPPHY